MITFRIIDSGFVFEARENTEYAVACGPRCVATSDAIICSFMVQSGLGINDFKPVIAHSSDGKHWCDLTFPWKSLSSRYSIFGSISLAPEGKLFFFGTRTKIENKGEPF